MKSEEKLNELFKTLREENVTTNISDVTTWINANQPITNLKSVKKTAITKKIIIMISIITTTIIGSIILFSGKQNIKPIGAIIAARAKVIHCDKRYSKLCSPLEIALL